MYIKNGFPGLNFILFIHFRSYFIILNTKNKEKIYEHIMQLTRFFVHNDKILLRMAVFLGRNLRQKLHILNVFKKIRFSNSKYIRKFLKNESKLGKFDIFKIFFFINIL
jgi:hypothetical protein